MPKREGDRVSQGEIVAEVDPATYRNAATLAEGRRDAAKAQLDALLAGTRPEDIDQARANFAAAQASLANAQASFARQKDLAARNVSSQQQLDDARMALDSASAKLAQTHAAMTEAINGPRSQDIDASRANLRAADAMLDLARTQLARTKLAAPSAGTVMTRVIEPGTVVLPAAAVYSIAIDGEVWVRAFAPEPLLRASGAERAGDAHHRCRQDISRPHRLRVAGSGVHTEDSGNAGIAHATRLSPARPGGEPGRRRASGHAGDNPPGGRQVMRLEFEESLPRSVRAWGAKRTRDGLGCRPHGQASSDPTVPMPADPSPRAARGEAVTGSIVDIAGLRYAYPDAVALDGIDAHIEPGMITGLVGPDGAGKTTLLRLIAGLLRPTAGTVPCSATTWRPMRPRCIPRSATCRRRSACTKTSASRKTSTCSPTCTPCRATCAPTRIERLLRFTGLAPFTTRLAGKLSGGMKQKLGLACALLSRPRLLLLDEPSVGVDPVSRRELWAIVTAMLEEGRADGMAVVWATAYLDEAARCGRVLLLHQGKLLADAPPDEFLAPLRGRVFRLTVPAGGRRAIARHAAQHPAVLDALVAGDTLRIVLRDERRSAGRRGAGRHRAGAIAATLRGWLHRAAGTREFSPSP